MFNQRFESALEIRYRDEVYQSDLRLIRLTLVLCVIFYSAFAVLDIILEVEYLKEFLIIRFGISNPVFIIALVWSKLPSFRRLHQFIISSAYVVAGAGIAVMLFLVPENFSYYGGLFLIFAVGHFLTRVYWGYATISSFIIILLHIVGVIISGEDMKLGLAFTSFYVGFIIICIYASYRAERYRRDEFLQTDNLKGDKVILERNLYDRLIDVENANRITIFSLARLAESRDKYTGNHIERVGSLCLEIAESLDEGYFIENGVDKKELLETIELASTLHDIGKVAIPEHILMKPGRLTEAEMEVMKKHTIYGYETLMQIRENYSKNDFVNMGIDICKYHHERWDGKGYPVGLAGKDIPLSARIVTVVDVFDALISERPYKNALSLGESIEILQQNRGKMFDPVIVDHFVHLFD